MAQRFTTQGVSSAFTVMPCWDGEWNGTSGSGVGEVAERSANGGVLVGGIAVQALFACYVELGAAAMLG